MAKISRKKKDAMRRAEERRPFQLKDTPLQDAMEAGSIGNAVMAALREPESTRQVPINAVQPTLADYVRLAKCDPADRPLVKPQVKAEPEAVKQTTLETSPQPAPKSRTDVGVSVNLSLPWLEWRCLGRVHSTVNIGVYHGQAGWEHGGVMNIDAKLMRAGDIAHYATI